jgi:hypothetical protein
MVNIWWIVAAVLAYFLFVRKASSYAGSIQAPVRRAHFDSDTYISFGGHGSNELQAGVNYAPADF